jgi:hypothetical protein
MDKVYLKIESCERCPHVRIERDYTSDSFEFCTKWDCDMSKRNIRRYVDWNDNKKVIPDWCPLIDTKKE